MINVTENGYVIMDDKAVGQIVGNTFRTTAHNVHGGPQSIIYAMSGCQFAYGLHDNIYDKLVIYKVDTLILTWEYTNKSQEKTIRKFSCPLGYFRDKEHSHPAANWLHGEQTFVSLLDMKQIEGPSIRPEKIERKKENTHGQRRLSDYDR